MSNPKIKIEYTSYDWAVEAIGLVALLLLFYLPAYHYSQLPETIPIHFGPGGAPDGYSGRAFIWVLPLIGLATYGGLLFLNRHPHLFNYSKKITRENAYREYQRATRFIRFINVFIVVIFCYLTDVIIQNGLGNQNGISPYFLPVVLVGMFGGIGLYWYRSTRKS